MAAGGGIAMGKEAMSARGWLARSLDWLCERVFRVLGLDELGL